MSHRKGDVGIRIVPQEKFHEIVVVAMEGHPHGRHFILLSTIHRRRSARCFGKAKWNGQETIEERRRDEGKGKLSKTNLHFQVRICLVLQEQFHRSKIFAQDRIVQRRISRTASVPFRLFHFALLPQSNRPNSTSNPNDINSIHPRMHACMLIAQSRWLVLSYLSQSVRVGPTVQEQSHSFVVGKFGRPK